MIIDYSVSYIIKMCHRDGCHFFLILKTLYFGGRTNGLIYIAFMQSYSQTAICSLTGMSVRYVCDFQKDIR